MTLKDFMKQHNFTVSSFAQRLGVPRTTVYRYLAGIRRPTREILERIQFITRGEVKAGDFYPDGIVPLNRPSNKKLAAQRIARIRSDAESDIKGNKEKAVKTAEEKRFTAAVKKYMMETIDSEWISFPVWQACVALGEKIEIDKKNKRLLLNDQIIDPKQAVRAANEILRRQSESLIHYPGLNAMHPGETPKLQDWTPL